MSGGGVTLIRTSKDKRALQTSKQILLWSGIELYINKKNSTFAITHF